VTEALVECFGRLFADFCQRLAATLHQLDCASASSRVQFRLYESRVCLLRIRIPCKQFACRIRISGFCHGLSEHALIERGKPLALGHRPVVIITLQEIASVELQGFLVSSGVLAYGKRRELQSIDGRIGCPTDYRICRNQERIGFGAGRSKRNSYRVKRCVEAFARVIRIGIGPEDLEQAFAR